jgi:hypothetical protein
MILKDRAKVLRAHVEERAASLLADFEHSMATEYAWDEDEIWKKAATEAARVVAEAQEKIAERCKQLGIPARFAPGLDLSWSGRGENAIKYRRDELRRVAEQKIEAMKKAAMFRIEKLSLDLQTQVVAMGIVSDESKLFLSSLAPIEEAMAALKFEDVEKQLELDKQGQRRLGRY